MVRRLGLLAGLCFGALGCGEEPAAEITVAVPVETWAWIGGDEDLELVLEPVDLRQEAKERRFAETNMLRERLALDPQEALFRLHLIGPAGAVGDPGKVQLSQAELKPFAAPPAELSPADRLLWQSVLQGLPAPTSEAEASPAAAPRVRRSVVLHGPVDAAEIRDSAIVTWSAGATQHSLRRRDWSMGARRHHLDAALTPVAEPPEIDE